MMRNLLVLFCCLMAIWSCKKKRAPVPPEAVQLIFPEQNSECTTGQSLGADTSQVEFRWIAADNTDSYELRVTNINTGTVQNIGTANTSARLPLAKGEPFTWLVRSRNTEVDQTVSSEQWSFYNAGSRTTFAPFPASIISPESAENVFKDISNEVSLSWSASDLDNDISGYEVYFSVETTPTTLLRSLSAGTTTIKTSVSSGTVYYWSVVVIDDEGNRSNSGVYSFKVL
ncbi:MAG: hypothetical protein WBB24_08940 [Maribacter sp.]